MSQTDQRLAELLGGAPPQPVQDLDEPAKRRLVELIEAALQHQDASIEQSLTKSVKHVPLPLRPLAKKVLLG